MHRRTFLLGSMAAPLLLRTSFAGAAPRVAVIGAGAFGGWSALHLLRAGAQVTLIDSWGPGNSRASSGGETRVIRGVYGPTAIYVKWTVRSFELWHDLEAAVNRKLYFNTGAIWMVHADDSYERAALPLLKAEGLAYQELTPAEAIKLYPQINFDGIRWILKEEQAGFLLARQSCQVVLQQFLAEGGNYQPGHVLPVGQTKNIELEDGRNIQADAYVFACGPWLSRLFPELANGNLIAPTRQEVFFFGTPAGDDRFNEGKMPVWIDHGERLIYGVPGNERRGFKVADDTRGPAFDPTSGERVITAASREAARNFLALRFPALKNAPVVESRVCQYENSPDQHFIVDHHPQMSNVWIIGGGSGHGFKHGPAMGEYVSRVVLGKQKINPFFALERLKPA